MLIKKNGEETESDNQFKASGSYHGTSPLETGSPCWDPGISAKAKPNPTRFAFPGMEKLRPGINLMRIDDFSK